MALQLFKIADVTVASPQASIDFASIPQGYTDLLIAISARTNRSGNNDGAIMTFNGNTSNYSERALEGNGSAASSFAGTNAGVYYIQVPGVQSPVQTFGNTNVYIPNYTGSTNKSIGVDYVTENNGTFALAGLTAALWSNSAAITSIAFIPQIGTAFLDNSTFTLYGVL